MIVQLLLITFGLSSICNYNSFIRPKNEIIETEIEIKELKGIDIDETTRNEINLLAQLVMAEAGDQDLLGKRYVVDVVLNRRDLPYWPDTVEEVIFQRKQFSCLYDGNFTRAASYISPDCYEAVELEYFGERLDYGVVFFNSGDWLKNGRNGWKYQDHWFGY